MKKIAYVLVIILVLSFVPGGITFAASGEANTADRLSVSVTMPEKREDEAFLLTDGFADTYVAFNRESTVRFDFSAEAATLVTVWESEPANAPTLRCFAGETLLSEDPLSVPYLCTVTQLPAGTNAVELTLSKSSLSDVCAFGAGELPEDVYQWTNADQPDVLLLAAYPGDEYRVYGGLLPKLVNDGANVVVCYCADHSRLQLESGFSALWALGVQNYPVRLGVQTRLSLDYKTLQRSWSREHGEKLLETAIKDLHPAVIIAPSDSADALPGDRIVCEYAKAICKKHRDYYQKLYVVDAGEDRLTVKDEILPLYENRSAREIAEEQLATFRSFDYWEYTVPAEVSYRLVYSASEAGAANEPFFENLSVTLHPAVTATPEPTPTPEPTEVPTEAPTSTPAPTEASTAAASATDTPAPVETPSATEKPKSGWFLSCAGREITPAPTEAPTEAPTPTPEPTEVPTPEPTPEAVELATPEPTEAPTEVPTEIPTEAPTEAPVRESEYFTAPGEPEELLMDRENGRWYFCDQNTNIQIRRVETTDSSNQPQVYFIAHVRMRNDQHRPGFGHETRNGMTSEKAYRIARRYGAVLLINGDNLINFKEAATLHSSLVRDGYAYQQKTGESVMAWNDRTLTFDVFDDNEMTTAELLERGYRNIYCFGPILLKDGEIPEKLASNRLNGENPRTGVGMVEPGHIVVIVVDGRQKDYSIGLHLTDFAKLFREEGCVSAYNLDGGVSAAMVFMGEHLNTHLNIKDYSQQRNIPDALLFGHTLLLPDENDPAPEFTGIRVGSDDQLYVAPQDPSYYNP